MTIRCGNHEAHGLHLEAHHLTAAQVRLCFHRGSIGLASIEEDADAASYDDFDPDAAYERFLETRYHDEIAWEEAQEARFV